VVFSSHVFIFYFLPVALLVYYALLPFRWPRHFSLTLLSYIFYGWANPRFVVLMFFNTLIDYIAGLVQAHNGFRGWSKEPLQLEPGAPRSRTQKIALIASITTNLSLLAFFKYFNFAYDNYAALATWLGVPGAALKTPCA
jgi:alginate O-acetyltransferase complex protein AlgI